MTDKTRRYSSLRKGETIWNVIEACLWDTQIGMLYQPTYITRNVTSCYGRDKEC